MSAPQTPEVNVNTDSTVDVPSVNMETPQTNPVPQTNTTSQTGEVPQTEEVTQTEERVSFEVVFFAKYYGNNMIYLKYYSG